MTESFTYLDLKLDLQKDQLAHLQSALQEEKQRKPPRSTIGSLKHELYQARRNNKPKHEIETIKSRIRQARLHRAHARKGGVKYNDVPVRLVNTSILRVRWNAVQPDINKTLSLFAKQTQVDDDISFVTDSSRELQGKELEDMIVERLDRGDIMEATGMVKTHYGLSTMEAKRYLDELSSKNNN